MTLAILPSDPIERRLLPILLMMFVAGVALACNEVVKWWKARMTQYRPPPLASLITYVREADGRWLVTQVLWLPVQHPRAFPQPLKVPVQSVQEDRPKKGGVIFGVMVLWSASQDTEQETLSSNHLLILRRYSTNSEMEALTA